jgi:elongation factor 2
MTDTVLKENSFKHGVTQKRYRLPDLVDIADSKSIELSRIYDGIQEINHRGTDSKGEKSSLWINLPESLDSLFYLAGMFFGDGDTYKHIHNDSEEIQNKIEREADKIGLSVNIRNDEGATDRLSLGGKTLRSILQDAFDFPYEDKSHSISVSTMVEKAPSKETSAFLRGYFDADGTVEGSSISVTSVSNEMLEDVQYLLNQFDIASNFSESQQTLYISGKSSVERFVKRIGFSHSGKQERATEQLEKSISAKVDRIPIDGSTLQDVRREANLSQMNITIGYDSYENNHSNLTRHSLRKFVNVFENEGVESHKLNQLKRLCVEDTSFVSVDNIDTKECDTVYDFGVKDLHNFVAEGLVVHNTTLSDNLLKRAGLMSAENAGEELGMDTEEDEQERGITIDAANISMKHDYEGDDYLINLIDTPGHVDFGGDVTRAMRAVDGVVILVDAVEGVMPQTETVVRQALSENVKPVLFINKVDRLIGELQESEATMQERLQEVIGETNELIRGMQQDTDRDWTVSVSDGTVGFGSALYNWGISQPMMAETGRSFSDIIEWEQNEQRDKLSQELPIEEVVLDMVVNHLPDPDMAQSLRVPEIWRGDASSDVGQAMMDVDRDAPPVFMVTDITVDPHSGEVATGRVFSGELRDGMDVNISGTAGMHTVGGVGIIMGDDRVTVDKVPAGNIAAVTGLDKAIAGSTVSTEEITPFETVEHISEPVITKSIEPTNMNDLPDLIEVLQQVSKEDPTIQVETDQETGENLISGQGELHLEVVSTRIEENHDLDVNTGEPIVIYREQPQKSSKEVEGISPNRHNRFYMTVETLSEDVVEGLKTGEINMGIPEQERRELLQEAGMDKDTSQNVETIIGDNILIDDTKGLQHLNETMELVIEGCEEALEEGPIAGEPTQSALVRLKDAKLHEDTIHRGPAQVVPAVRNAAHRALIDAETKLLEPIQDVRIEVPNDEMGSASSEIQSRRGRVGDMFQEGDQMIVEGQAPVEEMLGFSSDIRSKTGGRASWNLENAGFQLMSDSLQRDKALEIRDRKGMKDELPSGTDYLN